MRILREKRLNHELRNGVTLEQLYMKLINERELLVDNDRWLQASDCQKDINIVMEWIDLETNQARTSIQYPSVSEILDDLKN